jgi:hypothetical protein
MSVTVASCEDTILDKIAELAVRMDTMHADIRGLYASLAQLSQPAVRASAPASLDGDRDADADSTKRRGADKDVVLTTRCADGSVTAVTPTVCDHRCAQGPATTIDAHERESNESGSDIEMDLAEMMVELDNVLALPHTSSAQTPRSNLAGPSREAASLHAASSSGAWCEIGTHGADWADFFDFSPASRVIRVAIGAYRRHRLSSPTQRPPLGARAECVRQRRYVDSFERL